jgi:hypothetical protein
VQLQGGLAGQRKEYQDVVEEKRALGAEIAVYKRLIDAMDRRLRWEKSWERIRPAFRGGLLSNGSVHSLADRQGSVEGKDGKVVSSESEADDSGIFTKVKAAVLD